MNSAVFKKHFEQLYMPLCMYSLRVCGDLDTARDAVQEAFAACWQQIQSGLEINDFKPYIYRCVYNATLQALRTARHEMALDEAADITADDIDTSERDAALWQAVDLLPEGCRQVLLLSKRDGLSHAQIAEELGISTKTVENHMTRALRKLRAALRL